MSKQERVRGQLAAHFKKDQLRDTGGRWATGSGSRKELISKIRAKSDRISPAGHFHHHELKSEGKVSPFRTNEILSDKQGNKYVSKVASAMTDNPGYDTASEIVGMSLLKKVGASTAQIHLEKGNPPNQPKRLYSKFVPGKAVDALSSGDMPPNVEKHLKDNALWLRNGDSLKAAIQHPDLAKIHAVDVFAVNRDRHDGNLFYDSKSNRFHAIDNEGVFSDLTPPSTEKGIRESFKKVLSSTSLSPEELQNLKIFKDSLTKLTKIDHNRLTSQSNKLFDQIWQGTEKERQLMHEQRREAIDECRTLSVDLLASHAKDFKRLGIK